MTFKIRTMVPIAAIVCGFMLAAVPAAMAHEFEVSQAKTVLQDKGGKQVFVTGGSTVECEKEESSGVTQAKRAETNTEKVVYSGCTAFKAAAEVSQAKYTFNANGTVKLNNEIIVKAAGPKCEVKVPVAGNSNLGTVTYKNNQQNGTMEVEAEITGITSTLGGSGGLCPKGTNSTGTYTGSSVVWPWQCLPTQGGGYQDPQCMFGGPPQSYEWRYIPGQYVRWR
jgi:hypothetical protein